MKEGGGYVKGWKGRRRGETTSSLEKRKRKTDTLSFELEAKVLLELDRNSRRASAKGPKKTASSRKRKRTKGDGVTRLSNTFHVTSCKSCLYVLQFTFCDSNYADMTKTYERKSRNNGYFGQRLPSFLKLTFVFYENFKRANYTKAIKILR